MSAIFDFSANPSDGALTYVWDVSSTLINQNNVKTIKLLITDSATLGTLSSSIISTDVIPIYTYDLDSNIIGINKTFTVSGLINNKTYLAILEITTKAGTIYRSNGSISAYPGKPPIKPVFEITAVSGDLTANPKNGTVTFRLSNYTFNSESDGYYKITGVQAYIADGTNLKIYDFSNIEVSGNLYINTFTIGLNAQPSDDNGLVTGQLHEIAISVFNAAGTSVMSDTVLITPGNSVQAVSLVSMPTIEYNRTVLGTTTNASSATVLFANAPNAANLAGNASIVVQKYEIYRADASANNVVVSSNPKSLVATFDMSSGHLGTDGLSTGSSFTYNSSTYHFVFEDTSVVSGKNYTYYIIGYNSIGAGPSSNATTTLVGSYASAPVVTVTPGNQNLKLNIVPSLLNGLKATATPSYVIDVSGTTSVVTLDASNNYTVTGLTNGASYSVRVATRTTDGVRIASPYVGSYSSLIASTPYTTPAAPVITATAVDSSNVPLDGKIKLTWSAVTNLGGNSGAVTYSIFVNDVLSTTVSDTTYTVTGLTNGTSYKFSVKTNVVNTELSTTVTSGISNEINIVPFTVIGNVASASLTRVNGTSLTGAWTQPANALTYGLGVSNIRYKVKVIEDSSGTIQYDSSGSLVSPITISSLISGSLYKIEVTTGYLYSGTIYYNASPVIAYGTPYGTITAPTNFVLYPLNNSIRITWDRNVSNGGVTNILGYDVYITSTGVSEPTNYKAARVDYGTEYFVALKDGNLTDLFNGSQYRVKVNVVGTIPSGPSSTMEVSGDQASGLVTPAAGPAAPTITSVNNSNGSATVTWARDTITPANGYIILDASKNIIANIGVTDVSSVWTVTASSISFTYNNLTNNVAYPISIFAYKTASPLNITSAETSVTLYPAQALGSPTNLGFTVDSSSISLTWTQPTNVGQAGVSGNSALKYRVVIDPSDVSHPGSQVLVDNISTTFYTVNGLVNNKKYVAYVYAYYETSGGQVFSDPVSYFYIMPNPAPQTVTSLIATPGDKSVALSWINPTDTSIYPRTNTIIYRSTSLTPDASYTQIASVLSTDTTYTDSAVALYNGRTYYYKVLSPHGGVALEGAQQASPVYTTGVVPFGKPIIYDMSHNPGSSSYKVSVSRNGSDLQEYLLFAVDPSGLDIPVYNQNVGSVTYGGAIDNVNRVEAGNRYTLSISVTKAFDDILFGIQNSAGITIIHDGSLTFGSGNSFTIN